MRACTKGDGFSDAQEFKDVYFNDFDSYFLQCIDDTSTIKLKANFQSSISQTLVFQLERCDTKFNNVENVTTCALDSAINRFVEGITVQRGILTNKPDLKLYDQVP